MKLKNMERAAYNDLFKWKHSSNRKPVLLYGARRTGKTWLMKTFAAREYKKYVYINLQEQSHFQDIINNLAQMSQLILALEIESGLKVEAENTLLIFDEITQCEHGFEFLLKFNADFPDYHVMAATYCFSFSKLQSGMDILNNIDVIALYPLSYSEFLRGIRQKQLADALESTDLHVMTAEKKAFLYYLSIYLLVGGMPEVVTSFAEKQDFNEVRRIQKNILQDIQKNFITYAPKRLHKKLALLWGSMAGQLSKKNKKFAYSSIKSGGRTKEFDAALQWLTDTGIGIKVCRVVHPQSPLIAYENTQIFKFFLLDIGLMCAILDIDFKVLLKESALYELYHKVFTLQFVAQQLKSEKNIKLCYWSSESSNAEIDFLLQHQSYVFPLEVNGKENRQSKRLKAFTQKYSEKNVVRTSLSDFRREKNYINIPLYAISQISTLISKN